MLRRHADRVGQDAQNPGAGAIVEKRANPRVESAVGRNQLFKGHPTAGQLIALAMQGVKLAAEIASFGLRLDPVLPRGFEAGEEGHAGGLGLLMPGLGLRKPGLDPLTFARHFGKLGLELRQRGLRALHTLLGRAPRRTQSRNAGQRGKLGRTSDVDRVFNVPQPAKRRFQPRLDALKGRVTARSLLGKGDDLLLVLAEAIAHRRQTRAQV